MLGHFGNGIVEESPRLFVVVVESRIDGTLPSGLVGPFGIAYEPAVSLTVKPRAAAAELGGYSFRAPAPGFAELLFLARFCSPPIDRHEHGLLAAWNATWRGIRRIEADHNLHQARLAG